MALIGRWELDDTGATAADLAGYGNVGTFNGTVTKGVQGAGSGSKAVDFLGTGYALVNPTTLINNIAAAFTVAAWIFPTSTAAGGIINRHHTGVAIPFMLNAGGDGAFSISGHRLWGGYYVVGGGVIIQDPTTLPLNTWTHVAITWDGTTMRLYRNGVQVATAPLSNAPTTSANGTYIGLKYDSTAPFPGRIDDVRLYNNALTAAEVADLMAHTTPYWVDLGSISQGTYLHMLMNDEAGPIKDQSGWGANGGITGAPTFQAAGQNAASKAVQFDGASNYASTGGVHLDNLRDAWTISVWLYATEARTAVGQGPVQKGSGGGVDVPYALSLGNGTQSRVTVGFRNSAGTWYTASDTADLPLSTWWHYVGTWDGTTLRLYRNGVEVATATPGVAPVANANLLYIAAADGYFPGRLDDLRIYPRVLSAAEALALYTIGADNGAAFWLPHQEPVAMAGHWKLDETAGIPFDSSGNNHPIEIFGGTVQGLSGPVPGMKAYGFDGSDDFLRGYDSAYDAIAASYTIAAWVYPTAGRPTNNASILTKQFNGVTVPYTLAWGCDLVSGIGDKQMSVGHYHGAWSYALDPTDAPLNAWTHYIGTFDGTTLRLYRNGIQVASAAGTPVGGVNTGYLWIAASWTGATFFPGRLSGIRLYSSALTAEQALALYNREAGVAQPWIPLGAVA